MNQVLKKLDKSMNNFMLNLIKYKEDDPKYQQSLNTLAQQYQLDKTLF